MPGVLPTPLLTTTGGGGVASPTVASVASGDGTSNYTVNVPAGTVDGDLLIGVVASDWNTLANNTLPLASWLPLATSDYDGGTNQMHLGLFARVASSEPANYTVTIGGGADNVAAILRVTDWDNASGIAGAVAQIAPTVLSAGSGATSAPSITPFGSDDLLLTFYAVDGANGGGTLTWTPPSGMTEAVDRQSTTWTALEVASLQSPSNPTGTKAATCTPTNHGAGAACTISIKAAPAGGGGITGAAAVTAASDTSAASGQLGYSGASAATEAADTSTASGTVVNPVTGTAAVTQANQTASASGQLGYSGTSTRTQANQTSAASGQLGYSGTAAVTQAAQTASASGIFTAGGSFAGSVAVTQASQTSAATGSVGYAGSVAAIQANQTSTASGKLGYSGTLARTEANDTSSASGLVIIPITGTVARTQANQFATASGVNQPLVSFGTSSAGVGTAPSAHPNAGLAPYSVPASLPTPTASGASTGVPTSTGG